MKNIISALAVTLGLTISLLVGASLTANASPDISHDKYAHVSACYGAELALAECKPFTKWKPWQRALFTTAVIGGGKEWYDHNHPDNHTAEWGDVAADTVGAFGAEGTLWLVHKTW